MGEVTVYEKPTCSTCRRVSALLRKRGVDFDRVDYILDPLTEEQLRTLLRKMSARPRDVVRMKEPGARALTLDDDEATLQALVADPTLLQRPIVERGGRAVLARPPEAVVSLFE